MDNCPICLDVLFDDKMSNYLSAHLNYFVHKYKFAYASHADRAMAIQNYLVWADFSKFKNQNVVAQWKNCADIDMHTVTLPQCGHRLHARCINQLRMECYSYEEFYYGSGNGGSRSSGNGGGSSNRDSLRHVALPMVPPLERHYNDKTIKCPVCRVECGPNLFKSRPPDSVSSSGSMAGPLGPVGPLGPYKMYAGALVWMYNECFQPGHPQAGSMGRLLSQDPDKNNYAIIEDIVTHNKQSVPYCCVFDLMFLASTDIPTRDDVIGANPTLTLVSDWFSLPLACGAMDSCGDKLIARHLQDRIEYVNQFMAMENEIKALVSKYFETCANVCDLLIGRRRWIDVERFWTKRIMPRLGLQGLVQRCAPIVLSPIPYPYEVCEKVAEVNGCSQTYANYILRYIKSGYACNAKMFITCHTALYNILNHPNNTKYRGLPFGIRWRSWPSLDSVQLSLGIQSEWEMNEDHPSIKPETFFGNDDARSAHLKTLEHESIRLIFESGGATESSGTSDLNWDSIRQQILKIHCVDIFSVPWYKLSSKVKTELLQLSEEGPTYVAT